MVELAHVIANSLMLSSLYMIIAIGFTLIYGVGGVLNLSHGLNITLGAFSVFVATKTFGLPLLVGIAAGLLVPALFNAVLYKGLIGRVMEEPIVVMILTLLIFFIGEEAIRLWYGTNPAVVPEVFSGSTSLLGVTVQSNRLLAFVCSWLVVGSLYLFINRTMAGRSILALSMSRRGAALVGIDPETVNLLTWSLAGMLAGLAGYFLASFQTAQYNMGLDPLLLSFVIVIVGGIGSVRGSIVGAYLVGFAETLTTSYVNPRLTGATGLLILLLVVMLRPEGLFGREVESH